MRPSIFILGAAMALLAGTAAADGGSSILFAKGSCSLTVYGEPVACKVLSRLHIAKTARSNFGTFTDQGTIAFSGSEASVPAGGRHVLKLDSVIDSRAGPAPRTPASGACEARSSADGRVIERVTCRATSAAGEIVFEFVGDGAPADLVPLPPEGLTG